MLGNAAAVVLGGGGGGGFTRLLIRGTGPLPLEEEGSENRDLEPRHI